MCSMSFWKGMGAGLAVGLALGITAVPKKKCRSRTAGHFLRMVGDVVDSMGQSLGL